MQLFIPVTRIYTMMLYVIIGGSIYLIILILAKGLKQEDIQFFQETLSPLNMFKYIKRELTEKEKKE